VLLVRVHDRPSIRAALSKWPRRGCRPQRDQAWKDSCPDSAGVPGSSFLVARCGRDPSHRRSGGEGARLLTSPDQGRIRGRFRGDSGEIPGSLRASIERLFDGPRMQPTLVRCVGRCRMPSMALGGWDRGASGLQKRAAGAAMRAVQHSHTRATR
jgi:hypothetical protein